MPSIPTRRARTTLAALALIALPAAAAIGWSVHDRTPLDGAWHGIVLVDAVEVPFRFEIGERDGALVASFFDGDQRIPSAPGTRDGTTVVFTAQILIVVACASVFAWLLTVNQVPAVLVRWIEGMQLSPWMILLALNILLLVVGCFIDPLSAILILTPLLVPVITAAGINPVHFGIVLTVNLAIGLFHPPFGINIFVAQSVLGLKLPTIYRGILPFLVIYLIALALITYIPAISLAGMRLFF